MISRRTRTLWEKSGVSVEVKPLGDYLKVVVWDRERVMYLHYGTMEGPTWWKPWTWFIVPYLPVFNRSADALIEKALSKAKDLEKRQENSWEQFLKRWEEW